ncbi:histidinol-phosphate aminotransferase [Ochromonadaceae sp. CCMP2298]|nr:histidinol-phosphate aminotransferase [Ochromonadaceae sp. CCMP2298]|mmetsp:Transcript_3612/g.7813  ORF Transcript_3612/g.7813 Transcript_3612/m.7813 type:complete len:362 (-) Transcript_3612:242-1327(-)
MAQFASFDLSKVARKNILELAPYRCARDDYSEGVLLDANENSFGPAVTSHAHLALNRYPDPLHYEVKQPLAELRGVKKEQIFMGVGSDEAIDILFRIFCDPGKDNVVITPPTYGMYKVCAKVNDVAYKEAPLTPEFDVDMPTTLAAIDEHTKLVFLCSPGNPTCKVIPNSVVEEVLASFGGIVVVDEAYIDFSGTESACSLVAKYPNVVVLQTLSKAFGLAGIRLGMAFGDEAVIQLMNNVKAPYNVNKLTAEVALEGLKDQTLYRSNVASILLERGYLLQQLQALPQVKKIHHTDANFILFVVPKALEIYKIMADRGIVCRYRGSEMNCASCLRLTVGTRTENDAFIALFNAVMQELGVE